LTDRSKVVAKENRINEIDRKVLGTLTGRDKIKALLRDRGLQLRDFAEKHNLWREDVSRCLSGERPLPEVRDHLAEELGLTRAEVDDLIGVGVAA
jgi:hypothetical protein